MAPIKISSSRVAFSNVSNLPTNNRPLTRNATAKAVAASNNPPATRHTRLKRKAETSPSTESIAKRSALGDISNNKVVQQALNDKVKSQQPTKKLAQFNNIKTVIKGNENTVSKVQTRASVRHSESNSVSVKSKELNTAASKEQKIKSKDEFEQTEPSLYVTALEDSNLLNAPNSTAIVVTNAKENVPESLKINSNVTLVAQQFEVLLNLGDHSVPDGIVDYDKENWNDVFQVSHYTMDIFNYLKSREVQFKVDNYMDRQVCISRWMRSLLVDWMVEIQESFELNHETLYLGVRLADIYLSKVIVSKATLQLVGASSMLIASKYDERLPPLIDDFIYICNGAYNRRDLLKMEVSILKICDYNLGIPSGYTFLRRFARTGKVTMPILTLARFILELSLMDYNTITIRDSILAAAALYLALKMKNAGTWNRTLQFYSGYTSQEIMSTVYMLNDNLHRKPKEQLQTVRNKYTHKIFFEVAKVPLISNESLKLIKLEEKY